jgi:hypothetical protein
MNSERRVHEDAPPALAKLEVAHLAMARLKVEARKPRAPAERPA